MSRAAALRRALGIVCSLLMVQCGEQSVTAPQASSGAAKLAVDLTVPSVATVGRVGATISAADMDTVYQDLEVTADSLATGVILDIPVGTGRKLELAIYSADGIVTHYGYAAGLVAAESETLAVDIALVPLSGAVSVTGRVLVDNEPVGYSVTFEATWARPPP